MTAGEDEAEAIVVNTLLTLQRGLLRRGVELGGERAERGVETRPPPEHVDGLETPSRDKPARGLPGTPSRDHCSSAAANASCTASSARSKSPRRRDSVAKTRRDSVR